MARQIEDVLSEIDAWYNELPGGTERPMLLSKLAVLELCGWLEERFDSLAMDIAGVAGVSAARTVKEGIEKTFGFSYVGHVRQLFLVIGGEVLINRAEARLEAHSPGDLDRLKNILGDLWKQRCALAHASSVAAVGRQQVVNAPSWSINQQRIVGKLIGKFEAEIRAAIRVQLGAPPL